MPDTIDLGSIACDEGFFLVDEKPHAPFRAATVDGDEHYRHQFTYRGSDPAIKEAAIELIQRAREKIFLASFRIGDRDLLEALFAAVERLRGGVYIITSWTEKSLRRDLTSIEDLDDVDIRAQKKQFDELTRRGIALRAHEECHAKFLVVDDNSALISSANLETSAFVDRPIKRATGESGVVVTDSVEVNRLARFFTRLWYSGCTWEVLPGAEYALHRREAVPCPVTVPRSTAGSGVIWTYGENGNSELGLLRTLHEIIGLARHELLLSTFSLVGIRTRPEMLLDPLRRAIERHGLSTRLLVRGRNNIPGHRSDVAALAELGVEIHGDSDNHAKGVVADGVHGAIFSANFDADHGIFGGVEVGVRLEGGMALEEAHRYFEHAMKNADLRFVQQATQLELDQSLAARWRRRWPHGERITLTATRAEWERLSIATTTWPVLWEKTTELRIFAGGIVATLPPGADQSYLVSVQQAELPAAARLQKWFDERRKTSEIPPRGFCPAVFVRNAGH